MDYINIGPECFSDKAGHVISYKGSNFYKACDRIVKVNIYSTTHCVKRINHPNDCEDFVGNTKENDK